MTKQRTEFVEKLNALAAKLKAKPATARQIRGMIGGKSTATVYSRMRALTRLGYKVKRSRTEGSANVRGPKPDTFTVTGSARVEAK